MTVPYKIVDAAGKTVATINALAGEKIGIWQYSAAHPNGTYVAQFTAPAVAPTPAAQTFNRVTQ